MTSSDPASRSTRAPVIASRTIRDPNEAIAVTVVIPVYNGRSTIAQELDALADQRTSIHFEVLVSDNGSTDDTREVVAQWADRFAALTIVDSSQARGVAHARNEGARAALGSKILICDADDVVSPHWVEPLADALDQYDLVGSAAHPFFGDSVPVEAVTTGNDGLNSIFGFLPYALGGAMGVRREALLAVGGFDLSYQQGHEEADFGWRMQLAGYTLGWCPDAFLHYRQRTEVVAVARQNYYFARSAMLLWCRYTNQYPLSPLSFRGSVKRLLKEALTSYRLLMRGSRRGHAKSLGWAAGAVSGHVTYRLRGKLPPPVIMDSARTGS